MRVRAGARVPGVPDATTGRSSPTRRSVHAARETLPLVARARARRRRRRHPHARARARRRARRASRCATLIPHVDPARRRRASRRTRSARGCRARAVGRALWRALRARSSGAGWSAGRGSSTRRARAARACRRCERVHGGISRRLALVGDVPPARVPARAWPAHATSSGRCCGSRRSTHVELPPGDEPLVLVAPSTSQDPRAPAAARGAARAGRRAGAGAGDLEPPACRRRRCPCRPTRGSSSGSPTRARCRAATSWSATRATGRSCARCTPAARSRRARPAATWARTRRGWTGPGLGVRLPLGCCRAVTVRLAVERALADAVLRASGPPPWPPGRPATTDPPARPS